MTEFRYAATDLLTGANLGESIPLDVQSFGMALNGSGTLTGSLDLNEVYSVNAPFIAALACRRAVLWALADGYPVWCGVMWDWPDMSRAQGTLPISAQTIDSLWSKRLITDTIEYQDVELFDAFLDLVNYGLTKQSPYIEAGVSPAATRPAGYLAMVATQGRCARLILPAGGGSGSTWTAGYTYSDLSQVSSAWSDMCASGNLEYYFAPGLDMNGELCIYLRLGYTALGRPLADSGIVLTYPGNCLDYGYTITGSQSSNYVWATARQRRRGRGRHRSDRRRSQGHARRSEAADQRDGRRLEGPMRRPARARQHRPRRPRFDIAWAAQPRDRRGLSRQRRIAHRRCRCRQRRHSAIFGRL